MVTLTVNNRHLGVIAVALAIGGIFGRSPTLITNWWAPSSSPSSSASSSTPTPPIVPFHASSFGEVSNDGIDQRSGSIFSRGPMVKLERKKSSGNGTSTDDEDEDEISPSKKTTSSNNPKRGINIIRKQYNISFQDLAVVVITSSSTIDKRLPLLYDAWIKNAPFPVIILTDERNVTNAWDQRLNIRTSTCSGKINGLICKTKMAFEILDNEFKGRKWYLRLMDDTLVVLGNLLNVLNGVDPDQPW